MPEEQPEEPFGSWCGSLGLGLTERPSEGLGGPSACLPAYRQKSIAFVLSCPLLKLAKEGGCFAQGWGEPRSLVRLGLVFEIGSEACSQVWIGLEQPLPVGEPGLVASGLHLLQVEGLGFVVCAVSDDVAFVALAQGFELWCWEFSFGRDPLACCSSQELGSLGGQAVLLLAAGQLGCAEVFRGIACSMHDGLHGSLGTWPLLLLGFCASRCTHPMDEDRCTLRTCALLCTCAWGVRTSDTVYSAEVLGQIFESGRLPIDLGLLSWGPSL